MALPQGFSEIGSPPAEEQSTIEPQGSSGLPSGFTEIGDVQAKVEPLPELEAKTGTTAGDYGRSLAVGLNRFGQTIGRTIDVVGNIDPTGLLDKAGQGIESFYKEKEAEDLAAMSPAMKEAQSLKYTTDVKESWRDAPLKNFKSIFQGEAWKSPTKIVSSLLQSAPSTVVGMGTGVGITGSLIKKGVSSGLAGVIGGFVGEGGTAAIESGKDVYDLVISAPTDIISKTPEFQKAMQALSSEQLTDEEKEKQVRELIADHAAMKSMAKVFTATGLLGSVSGHYMGKLLGGEATGGLSRKALTEGSLEALQETPQSGYEVLEQNFQKKKFVDPNQDIWQGVKEASVEGGVQGFVMGTGMGGGAAAMTSPRAVVSQKQADTAATTNMKVNGFVSSDDSAAGVDIVGGFGFVNEPLEKVIDTLTSAPMNVLTDQLTDDVLSSEHFQRIIRELSQSGVAPEDMKAAIIERVVPTMTASLQLGIALRETTTVQRRQLLSDLNNVQDPKSRIKAVEQIEKGISDQRLAKSWANSAIDRINAGSQISYDQSLIDFASQDEESLKAMREATVDTANANFKEDLRRKLDNLKKHKKPTDRVKSNIITIEHQLGQIEQEEASSATSQVESQPSTQQEEKESQPSSELQKAQEGNQRGAEEEILNSMADTQQSINVQDEVKGRRQRFNKLQDDALMDQFVDDAEEIKRQNDPVKLAQENANLHNSVMNKLKSDQPLSEKEEAYKQEYLTAQREQKNKTEKLKKEREELLAYENSYSPMPGEQAARDRNLENQFVDDAIDIEQQDTDKTFPREIKAHEQNVKQQRQEFIDKNKKARTKKIHDELNKKYSDKESAGVIAMADPEMLKQAKKEADTIVRSNPVYEQKAAIKKSGGLNLSQAKELYGDSVTGAYPGLFSMKVPGGPTPLDIDTTATEYGYKNADEMFKAFAQAPTIKSETAKLVQQYEQEWSRAQADQEAAGVVTAKEIRKEAEAAGVQTKQSIAQEELLQPTDKISGEKGITANKAIEMFAAGDSTVMGHVEEEIKRHGVKAMQDVLLNKLMLKVAQTPKGEARQKILKNISPLEAKAKELFSLAEAAEEVEPTTKRQRIKEKLAAKTTAKPTAKPEKVATSLSDEKTPTIAEVDADIKFSKSRPESKASNQSDIRSELSQPGNLGRLGVRNLESKGLLEIINPEKAKEILVATGEFSERDDAVMQGFTMPVNGKPKTFLIQGNIKNGRAMSVMLHELSEHVFELGFIDSTQYGKVLSQLKRKSKLNSKEGSEIRAAYDAVPKETDPNHVDREVMAYLIEQGKTNLSIVRRFIAEIKKILVEKMGISPVILKNIDLQALALNVVKREARGTVGESLQNGINEFAQNTNLAFSEAKKAITYNPAFRKWFGDSKVVDDNGEPLVVYHGTGAEISIEDGFIFDYDKIGEQGRSEGAGFYFTSNRRVAEGYGADGTIIEAYMSIQKPLAYDSPPFDIDTVEKIISRIAEIEAKDYEIDIEDGFLSNYGDTRYDGLENVVASAAEAIADEETALDQLGGFIGSGVEASHVNQAVRDITGYDGVITGGFGGKGSEVPIYVAFFPEQIKSIYNTGTFDANNPDIRFSKTGEKVTDKLRRWFGASKLKDKSGNPIVAYHGSPEEFYEFGNTNKRGKTGHTSSGLGDFFSLNKKTSSKYGNVKPFFLKMENPYMMSLEESQSFNTLADSVKRREELQGQGYDSILIKVPGLKEGSMNPYLITFEGNQVKSADNNTGEYSLTDNDVRYSIAKQDSPAPQESIENIMSKLRSTSTTKADAAKYGTEKEQNMVAEYRKLASLAKDSHSSIATKQKMIASFLKVVPPEVRAKVIAPLTFISRFMQVGAHEKRLAETIARAEKELTTYLRKGLISDIQKGVKPSKLAKNRVKKSTLGYEASRDLDFIRETLKEKDIPGKIAYIDNQIVEKELEIEENGTKKAEEELADLESHRNILETFGNIKEQNLEDLIFAKEALASIIQDGRALWRLQQEAFKAAMLPIITNVQQDISGEEEPVVETAAQATKRREKEATVKGKVKKTWDAVEDSLLSWEFLMNKLSSKSGYKILQSFTTKSMLDVAKKATDEEIRLKLESDKEIHEKAMEIFNAKKDSELNKKFMAQEERQHGKVFSYDEKGKRLGDFTMSQQEAAYMYAIRKNDDSIPTFERMDMTDKTFEEIEKFIAPELKAFVDYNVDTYLQDFHFDVNQVYRQVYGTNLTKTPGYISWYRDLPGKTQDKGIAAAPAETGAKGMSKGAFKERVKNTNPYRFMSFNDVLIKHVDEMNNFRAWAMPTKIINAVFNNRNTRRLITQHHGSSMSKNVARFQSDFTKSPTELRGDLPWLDKLRGNITTAMTALNPTIFLKQLTSIPAMAESIPTAEWLKNSGAFWANPLKAWNTLQKSKAWEGRRQMGMERDIRTAQAVSGSQAIANMQNIKNRAMFLVKWGDGAAILVGGYPVYKYHYDKNLAGKGHDQAHRIALDEFEKAMDRTQQSSGIKDQGNIQRSGSYAKLFTMFITSPKQYTSQITAAIRGIKNNPADGDAYKRLFIFGVLMPSLFQATATGMLGLIGGDADEKEKAINDQIKAIVTAPLNGIPIIRDLQKAALESAMGNWYGTDVDYSPVTQAGKSLMGAIYNGAKLFTGENEEDYKKHGNAALMNLWETIGYATGLPANTVRKTVAENWRDVIEGQTEYPLRRSLGYSRAAMGERGSRFERNKKKVKNAIDRQKNKEARPGDIELLRLSVALKKAESSERNLKKLLKNAKTDAARKAINAKIEKVREQFNNRFSSQKMIQ